MKEENNLTPAGAHLSSLTLRGAPKATRAYWTLGCQETDSQLCDLQPLPLRESRCWEGLEGRQLFCSRVSAFIN